MDRRQQKTRTAIFQAFTGLLEQKNYSAITVQEIIDRANIGRSTFYAHFETKDALLQVLCKELFDHIIDTAKDRSHTHGLTLHSEAPNSVFCHILQHLQENDNGILTLLSCESNDFFLRYFKDSLSAMIDSQFIQQPDRTQSDIPDAFLVNHIAGSFVEMVQWWLKEGMTLRPEELSGYFQAVIAPIL